MDRDFLKNQASALLKKLGPFGGMFKIAAAQVIVPLEAGDIEGAKARVHELEEAADALKAWCRERKVDLEDNELDATELADALNGLLTIADEFEDVATGVDEDDPVRADG